MTRHLIGLFSGQPGARGFRRVLTSEAVKPGAGVEVIFQALAELDRGRAERALAA
jgi:tRNA-dihydrouridine synthase A